MTTTSRTPSQITDREIERAVSVTAATPDPAGRALEIIYANAIRQQDHFWWLSLDDSPREPEVMRAWDAGSAERIALDERIRRAVEARRSWTMPERLETAEGRELVATLAWLCWRHGTPTWDTVEGALAQVEHIHALAAAVGYPEHIGVAEILPAVDAAWLEIAAARDA